MFKQSAEYKSIQKKLVAAVAMVLVACIMVVSSSYAWFTLSTAPEVTGIQTAVGSNGNLEMALRTVENINDIQNGQGLTMPNANSTWGNLVDLSYNDTYGLDKITLAPARLNAAESEADRVTKEITVTSTNKAELEEYKVNGKYNGYEITAVSDISETKDEGTQVTTYSRKLTVVVRTFKMINNGHNGYLQTPEYGTDGRVSQVTANTVNGPYNTTNQQFSGVDNAYGVRAIGLTSSISPGALALRQAKQSVQNAITEATTVAKNSLRDDAVNMANILIKKEIGGTYTVADYNNVMTAISNLETVGTYLENALKEAVVAVGVAQNKTFTTADVVFSSSDIVVKVKNNEITLDWTAHEETRDGETIIHPDLTGKKTRLLSAYNALHGTGGIFTKLTAAKGADVMKQADGSVANVTYENLMAIMIHIMDANDMVIKDGADYKTISALKAAYPDNIQLGLKFVGGLEMKFVKGVYYDIGTFVGEYKQDTTMSVTYADYSSEPINVKVNMLVAPGLNDYYLPEIITWMSSLPTPGGNASTLITDFYGYVLDFAFRTNAIDSSLLLQTEGTSRVGDDQTVQGGGSFMKFKPGHSDFTYMQTLNLMGAIRVVFVNDEGDIYGVAALDVTLVHLNDTDKDGILETGEGDKVLFDPAEHKYYIEETVGKNVVKYAAKLADAVEDGDYIKAFMYMYNYSMTGSVLELREKKESSVITDLQQNVAEAVSVLVFLDGDTVENGDVAIGGNSMTGTMNLQFASSAELDPMDYTFDTKTPLVAPTAAVNSNTLTITDTQNGENVAGYKLNVYGADSVLLKSVDITKDKIASGIDLSAYVIDELKGQTVQITVVAVPAEGSTTHSNSAESAPVDWTIPA